MTTASLHRYSAWRTTLHAGRSVDATRALLLCGTVAGPLFVIASAVQALTRQGFDLARHPISLLLLGDAGWIQAMNFEITGLLVLAFAVGMRRALHPGRAGTWGPILVGAYGAGTAVAGIFGPDPAYGFPPGALDGMPATVSGHNIVHGAAFLVAIVALTAATFVLARRFASLRLRGWAAYCVATGFVAPILVAASMANQPGGIPMFADGVVMSAWISIIAGRLLAERRLAESGEPSRERLS
jgi:hypothetical protein